MPFFKTTHNILTAVDEDELFNPNWMDSDKLILPPKKDWDYNREMQIEDVNVWEVLYQASGGIGVYAAWDPFAEFYMLTTGWLPRKEHQTINDKIIETYYGPKAQNQVYNRAKELGIPLKINSVWVDEDKLWLYK